MLKILLMMVLIVLPSFTYEIIIDKNLDEKLYHMVDRVVKSDKVIDIRNENKKVSKAKKVLTKKKTHTSKTYFSLTVKPTPSSARVYITNIKPVYHDGMKLKRGTYKIKVVKKGYKTKLNTIYLYSDSTRYITLEKESNHSNKDRCYKSGKLVPTWICEPKYRGYITEVGRHRRYASSDKKITDTIKKMYIKFAKHNAIIKLSEKLKNKPKYRSIKSSQIRQLKKWISKDEKYFYVLVGIKKENNK